MTRRSFVIPGKQRGAVLIVSLVLLLVLTLLGTAGLQDTTMEERMAGNFRDHSIAMQAAETALRTGEVQVTSTTLYTALLFNSTDGTHEVETSTSSVDPKDPGQYGRSVTDANVLEDSGGHPLQNSAPEYYIEKLPEIQLPASDLTVGFQDQAPRVNYYRVTAKGVGVSPNAEAILQSTYFR